MKTIHQRLQSRISKRRNFIHHCEVEVAIIKARRQAIADIDLGFEEIVDNLSDQLGQARGIVRELAGDQKLDKQLLNTLTGIGRVLRVS